MSQVSISRDDPRVESLRYVANYVLKDTLKDAVKEALVEWEQESKGPGPTTESSGDSGGRLVSGRTVIVGLALVGGAAYLANRLGILPDAGELGMEEVEVHRPGPDVGGSRTSEGRHEEPSTGDEGDGGDETPETGGI